MKQLLDISTLVSLVWEESEHHEQAVRWREGKTLVLCPLSELGFIRVSMSPAFNATMEQARTALSDFIRHETPEFIAADIRALDGKAAPSAAKTTDWYLANLAHAHGMAWATCDHKAKHPAAVLVG